MPTLKSRRSGQDLRNHPLVRRDRPLAGPKDCPSCEADTEEWWNYCAMCGWHIASGAKPTRKRMAND